MTAIVELLLDGIRPDKGYSDSMMTQSTVTRHLLSELAAGGKQGRVVSIRRLEDLRTAIDSHRRKGHFDEEFDRTRLSFFRYDPPETLPGPLSLIIVAVPRPQTQALFTWQGKQYPLILPPTYTDYDRVAQQVIDLVMGVLGPAGYRVARSALPLKSLAVGSGLGAYGRNNICYVPGMGSFLELVGLYSDLACSEDAWQEARMMEACQACRACLRHCPTGAITEERFLLRAERCLTFHNEQPGNVPFPSWIDPSWHNCLEGCMHCQRTCPEDQPFWGWIDGREQFSEEETALLLRGEPQGRLPDATTGKLERLGILGDLGIVPRNLGVFLGSWRVENT